MSSKLNTNIKSSLVYIIATVIGQGMMFLGIIVFTRLMSQEDYGLYSTYYAYVSLITVLVGANLYYALNNAYIDKKDQIIEFRKSVLVLSAIIMSIVLVGGWIIGDKLLNKLSPFIVIMLTFHSYGFFVINYRMYSANMENDYKKKQWLLILPNTLQLLISVILICTMFFGGFNARVVGSTLGVGCVALVSFIEMIRCPGKFINIEHWKYALSIALPSMIMSLSYMLMQQCDKVMITNMCGAEETAIYSSIYYIGYALIAVDQAVAPVRQAWIFKKLDTKNISEAKIIQKWYLMIMAFIAMSLVAVGPEIIKIIVPQNYWVFEYIVPFVISAFMMMLYRFYTEIMLFYKKNTLLSVCVLICALLNIYLNQIFIPKFGAVAACYTTVVAYIILFLLSWKSANNCIRGIYSGKYFCIFLGIVTVGSKVFYSVYKYYIYRYFLYAVFVLLFIIYFWNKKEEWKQFL